MTNGSATRSVYAGGAFARRIVPHQFSVELIDQGIVRDLTGFFYLSPAAVIRAAAELRASGPLPERWEDQIAAVVGRVIERAKDAESRR